ncbi:hypothetical protein GF337_16960 [candidate division KSB1 bacterium]|nr:hypothetical protein [candidate division KSB1 bacterium]
MRLLHFAILSFFILLIGCGENDTEQQENISVKDIKNEAEDVYETTKKLTQQEKDELLRKMNNQLDSLNQDIAELKEDAENTSAATKEKMEQQIKVMENQADSLGNKIENFGKASGKAWNDFVAGAQKSLNDLEKAVEKAKERFE